LRVECGEVSGEIILVGRIGIGERVENVARHDSAAFGIELVVRIAVGMDVAEAVVDVALRNVEQRNLVRDLRLDQVGIVGLVDQIARPILESQTDLDEQPGLMDFEQIARPRRIQVSVEAGRHQGRDFDLVTADRGGERGKVGGRGDDPQRLRP
jgi:hypothetical protein